MTQKQGTKKGGGAMDKETRNMMIEEMEAAAAWWLNTEKSCRAMVVTPAVARMRGNVLLTKVVELKGSVR